MEVTAARTIRLRIPEILKEKGWTATKLMRVSGLSWPTVQGLSSGKQMNLTLNTIRLLCDALEVSIEELIIIESEN